MGGRLTLRAFGRIGTAVSIAAACVLPLSASRTQNPPAAPPGPPPPANAVIAGRVVDSSGDGVGGAAVVLTPYITSGSIVRPGEPAPAGVPRVLRVLADANGGFVFAHLLPATWRITVTKPGYIEGQYGKRRVDGTGTTFDLPAGARMIDLRIVVWKHAVIAGTLLDAADEPVVGVSVRAVQRTFAAGQRRLVSLGTAVSDDRGIFRIGALPPGDYIVAATSTLTSIPTSVAADHARDPASAGAFRQIIAVAKPAGDRDGMALDGVTVSAFERAIALPTRGADGRLRVVPTTFHPEAHTIAQAAIVSLQAGDVRAGVDIRLRSVAAAKLRGRLIGPAGPLALTRVQLVPVEADAISTEDTFDTAVGITSARGEFMLPGVPAGSYVLRASQRPAPEAPAAGARGTPLPAAAEASVPTFWVAEPLTVAGDDLDLTIAATAGFRVEGRFDFVGQAARPAQDRLQRGIASIEPAMSRASGVLSLLGDGSGTFVWNGVPPGRYLFRAGSFPGWHLKSIALQGRDITDAPIDITSDLTDVVITMIDKPTEIGGVVNVTSGSPADAAVLIFPADRTAWTSFGSGQRLKMVRPSPAGAFTITGLLAGEYFVAAIPEASVRAWEPEFLQVLARAATRVHLNAGEKLTQNLAVGTIR
jgi:hypothetical protein